MKSINRWKLSDIQKMQADGKIKGFRDTNNAKNVTKKPKSGTKLPKSESPGLLFIKQHLRTCGIDFVTELQFAKPRKFRFDIALPALHIAIEYEGLVATGKKGGHQTKAGYTSNCEKYNLAASLGWKVYRYTSRNYKQFENDLKGILNETRL